MRFANVSVLADAAGEDSWCVTDELYNFHSNPRPWVQVSVTLATVHYTGSTMDGDHPIA